MLEGYEPSMVAWRILSSLADAAARGPAGLLRVAADGAGRDLIGSDASSRVLLFNTEGATALATYRRLVGLTD